MGTGLEFAEKTRSECISFCFEYTVAEDARDLLGKKVHNKDCIYSILKGMEKDEQPWGFSRRLTSL